MQLDTLIALITIGLLIWYKLADLVTWLAPRPATSADPPPEPVKRSRKTVRYQGRAGRAGRSRAMNALHARSALPDARSASPERSSVQGERSEKSAPSAPAGALPVNAEELTRLAKAITLKAQGATKQEAVEGGFGVRKGGTEGYRRAVTLFDTATRGEG